MAYGPDGICRAHVRSTSQFHHYNPGKSEFGENRYFKISERIYGELNERLSQSNF